MGRFFRWSGLVAGSLLALLSACAGNGHPQPTPPPDVHVAGYQFNGTANVAMYWKNGTPVALTDGTKDAKAMAVVVSGGDVYIAGGWSSDTNVGVAGYWKNGVPMPVTDGARSAFAESIVVVGSDVYVAGYEQDGMGRNIPTYWKNGEAMPLAGPTSGSGEAGSIAVSGKDVFVAGWTYETVEVAPNNHNIGPVAKVWKNGVESWLTDGITKMSVAESLVVSGQDAYVVGYTAPWGQGSFPYTACYWKNGTAVPLTDGTFGAKAFSLALSAGTVYAAGFTTAGGGDMATVWKDGTPATWTNGRSTALILAMAVSGADVHAVGYDGNTASYWHNGTAVALTDGRQVAEAQAICLTPR